MELPFTEAFKLGHHVIASGDLRNLQEWLSLSDTRLAGHLGTNTTSLRRWFDDPGVAVRMHSTTAARIGQWAYSTGLRIQTLLEMGVDVSTLFPLSIIAGQLGRSTQSLLFSRMCRSGEITCYDLGTLGVYVPKADIPRLKEGSRQ